MVTLRYIIRLLGLVTSPYNSICVVAIAVLKLAHKINTYLPLFAIIFNKICFCSKKNPKLRL